mgnify:FL=1
MTNSIILALSASIDSLGIGITYGLKNAQIHFLSKCILFVMSIFFAVCSLFIGNLISTFLPEFFTNIISSTILVIIGILVLIDPIPFDFDHSRKIDIKESLVLRGCTFS